MLRVHAYTITQAMFNLLKDDLKIELEVRDGNDPEKFIAVYKAHLKYDKKTDSIIPKLNEKIIFGEDSVVFFTWKISLNKKYCIALTSYGLKSICFKKGDILEFL